MLASNGSLEQMKACGLKTVRQQMHLKKLISSTAAGIHGNSSSSSTSSATTNVDRKLSLTEIKKMKKEEKYIYLIK